MANETSGKDWTVIKSKIFTPKLNFYGLLVVIFDNVKNSVENLSLVFSIYSETHDLQLDEKWDTFEKKIQDMIFGGNFSQTVTMSTADKLKADMGLSSFGSELKDNINKNDISLVNKQIKHILSKTLNDANLEIDCEMEFLSSEELKQGRVREGLPPETLNKEIDKETPTDARLVKAKLILAPVDGKLITELREGDTIMLNLIPISMAENMILDKLKLRRPDGSGRPVPGKIIKIKSLPKGWQLLVHITENYYTKIVEEEKILIKTPVSGPIQSGKNPVIKNDRGKSGISWIAIAIIILLGMVITYFVFLGG